jgi:hypothetical protein
MRFPSNPGWFVLALVVAFGCQPNIGDDCTNHAQCAYTGDRICEPNFPGGYCTKFNCEPGNCPDEAVCVAYGTAPSERPECADPTDRRLLRTFCMKSCSERSDCRTSEGYDCVDLSDAKQNPWGAVIVERGSYPRKICTLPLAGDLSSASGDVTSSTGVCSPPSLTDGSFPPPYVYPDAGTGGAATDASLGADAAGSAPDAGAGAARDAAPPLRDARASDARDAP